MLLIFLGIYVWKFEGIGVSEFYVFGVEMDIYNLFVRGMGCDYDGNIYIGGDLFWIFDWEI